MWIGQIFKRDIKCGLNSIDKQTETVSKVACKQNEFEIESKSPQQ